MSEIHPIIKCVGSSISALAPPCTLHDKWCTMTLEVGNSKWVVRLEIRSKIGRNCTVYAGLKLLIHDSNHLWDHWAYRSSPSLILGIRKNVVSTAGSACSWKSGCAAKQILSSHLWSLSPAMPQLPPLSPIIMLMLIIMPWVCNDCGYTTSYLQFLVFVDTPLLLAVPLLVWLSQPPVCTQFLVCIIQLK